MSSLTEMPCSRGAEASAHRNARTVRAHSWDRNPGRGNENARGVRHATGSASLAGNDSRDVSRDDSKSDHDRLHAEHPSSRKLGAAGGGGQEKSPIPPPAPA